MNSRLIACEIETMSIRSNSASVLVLSMPSLSPLNRIDLLSTDSAMFPLTVRVTITSQIDVVDFPLAESCASPLNCPMICDPGSTHGLFCAFARVSIAADSMRMHRTLPLSLLLLIWTPPSGCGSEPHGSRPHVKSWKVRHLHPHRLYHRRPPYRATDHVHSNSHSRTRLSRKDTLAACSARCPLSSDTWKHAARRRPGILSCISCVQYKYGLVAMPKSLTS